MKRIPEFRILSSDHHRALVLAKKAKKAGADNDLSIEKAWSDLEKYFKLELELHFDIEETYIGAPLMKAGETAIAERLYEDHKALRSFFKSGSSLSPANLKTFGELLEKHVRFEERELFEVAQKYLSREMLYALEQACIKDNHRDD